MLLTLANLIQIVLLEEIRISHPQEVRVRFLGQGILLANHHYMIVHEDFHLSMEIPEENQ